MIFTSTVRRLTVIYSLIQLAVFASLAIAVYVFVTVRFDFDTASTDGGATGTAEHGFLLLRIALIAGFAVLCVVAPFISYWMARVALGPLKQSYEQQQHFVDDASHELRGPLSIIQGELELALTRPRSAAEYQQAMTASLAEAHTLIQMTDDLLVLARDPRETLAAHFEPTRSDEIVRDALAMLPSAARARITAAPCASVPLHAAAGLLVRAVANLVDNAIKFSPDDTSVIVSVQESRDDVLFRVTDHGGGMTADEVSHAFDRFWRASSSAAVDGHGLGLALVRRIAELHAGKVSVISSPGAGTTVTLAIPSARRSASRGDD